jgi:Ca2+-binding RTX toxin-like protein
MATNIITVAPPTGNAETDTAAIKTAIEAAHKAYLQNPTEQVTVQLGTGTYVVTGDKNNPSAGPVELLSGVSLVGAGMGETTIKLTDDFNARINGIVRTALGDVSDVSVKNLTIDGNRANNTTGDPNKDHQAGFICGDKDDVQSNITLTGVEIKNCTAYGFNPHEVSYNVTITNCVSHGNGLDGYVADGVVGGVYANNLAYDNDRHGFNIQNASTDLDLTNNKAYDNGSAGVTIQRGDIYRDGATTIDWVTDIRITGGEYYGNAKEGILVKLSDHITIDGTSIHDNLTQGVRIEGSTNTVVKNSQIFNNSQLADNTYDEINIRLRDDAAISGHTYYSTGTQILNNAIYSDGAINSRWGVREEPTNDDGGPTGTYLSGNTYSGMDTGTASVPGQPKPVFGTSGNDTIAGTAGGDEMHGLAGNDTYTVNHSQDVVIENVNDGNDTVLASITHTLAANVENLTLTGTNAINGYGNELDNLIIGNSANNVLKGYAGNDTLNGGAGADTMTGGDGDDVYFVDNAGDVVQESANGGLGGRDRVYSSISYTLPTQVEELVLTGSANLSGTGNTGANLLIGNAGNNVLNGLGGADTMSGGAGNDTYYVDHTGDVVMENDGGGTDTVYSTISYTLTQYVENLILQAGAVIGSGNDLGNMITGNDAANKLYGLSGDDILQGGGGNDLLDGGLGSDTLNGGIGADTMVGGAGNDVYYVDDAGDVVTETADGGAADLVYTSISYTLPDFVENMTAIGLTAIDLTGNGLANTLTGNAANNLLNGDVGDDVLIGNAGNDTLDGGTGADRMVGGVGNDTYYIDNIKDVVVETATGGAADTVITSISYTLANYVENLVAAGSAAVILTGNSLNNRITGNEVANSLYGGAGNDILNGGAGADRMLGGVGNDTYYVDNAKDLVIETATGGTADRVVTSISYTLVNYVENLAGTGSGAISLTGNGLNNRITGNVANNRISGGAGNDALNGGLGNDVLKGGAGQDRFLFTTALNAVANVDTITDFNVADDTIYLENAIFKKLVKTGALDSRFFKIGSKAADANDYIIYNKNTGYLYYDADGIGKGAAVLFAKLAPHLSLTYKDFIVM